MKISTKELMGELFTLANEDGELTEDEIQVLQQVSINLGKFAELIEEIKSDNVIDFEEFQELRKIRQAIFNDVFSVAILDEKITNDERQLLIRLIELIYEVR